MSDEKQGLTAAYVQWAIEEAEAGRPRRFPPVLGYTSSKVQRLIHLLCRPEGTRYLEIGTHLGGTLIPALWGNPHVVAACLDNWTWGWTADDSPQRATRERLQEKLDTWVPEADVLVVEGDMFTVDLAPFPRDITVFFYDGPHSRQGQYQGFVRFDPLFAHRFVTLVDDWNWVEPREQTARAFKDLRYRVEAEWILPAVTQRDVEQWWNGLYVALVEKS